MLTLPASGSYLEFKTNFENQFCEHVYLIQHFERQKEDKTLNLRLIHTLGSLKASSWPV
jgi:hypothetical protein